MPRSRRQSRVQLRRSRAARDPARSRVDLAIRFRIEDGVEAGCYTRPYGGVWDKLLGRYLCIWDPAASGGEGGWVGDEKIRPKRIHVVKVSAQSIGFIEDFEATINMAVGGRRSGKTMALAIKIAVCLLLFAGKEGEELSPTYRQAHNVWRAVLRITPRNWWSRLHRTDHRMECVNGSTIQLLSADRDDAARSEGVAWGAYDERQDIPEEAFSNALMSTSEGGDSPVIFETATIKLSLREHYDDLQKSADGAVYHMRSRGNPFISSRIFDIAEQFLDAATIERELEARWPELQGRCYYPFAVETHVHPWGLKALTDVTKAYGEAKFNAPVDWLVGLDPPRHAVICKVYAGDVLHVAKEIVTPMRGDVRDTARLCREAIGTDAALVISDPHETRWDADVRRYFRAERFRFGGMRRVDVEYRLTAVRARMERRTSPVSVAQGSRVVQVAYPLLMVDPSCVHLIESLSEQIYVNARPDKLTASKITPEFTLDHPPDSLGYLVYRLWPAPARSEDYETIQKRVEREDRKKKRAA